MVDVGSSSWVDSNIFLGVVVVSVGLIAAFLLGVAVVSVGLVSAFYAMYELYKKKTGKT